MMARYSTAVLFLLGAASVQGLDIKSLFGNTSLILQPPSHEGKAAGIVMIGGAFISNTAYKPMLEKLQASAARKGISLYAGIPWYAGDTPNPVDLKYRVNDIISQFQSSGLPKDAPMFYAAHSLGTVFLQDFVNGLGSRASGQILMGGFLLRKHITPKVDFNVSTLTLGAELDGLARVTRITESFYHQKGRADLPVVVLMGQNHMQFASGDPPINVRRNDLQAEVDENAAHDNIASVSADYLALRLGLSTGDFLKTHVEATAKFLEPVITAYELEGSRRFNMPAQVGGDDAKQCVRGLCPGHSPWSLEAQKTISKMPDGVNLVIDNRYVDLGGSPVTGCDFHLPTVQSDGKTVNIKTYSGCYWNDPIDEQYEKFDTGFTFTSAQEIGTKLESRQCSLNLGLNESVNFSVDDPDFCAMTNQKAYDWAMDHAPKQTVERFKARGIAFVMARSKEVAGGPLFLYERLSFEKKTVGGKDVMEVTSVSQKTEQDYWKKHFPFPKPASLPDPGCYHYCKLLSPARVLEWMLVDGLRATKNASMTELVI